MKIAHCFALLAAGLAVTIAGAQTPPSPAQQKADQVLLKARKVDLLNQILPVLMTKDQIGKLLPVIEKARAAVKAVEEKERGELGALEPKLDAAIKEALDKNLVPSRDVLNNAYATFQMMQLRRQSIVNQNVDALLKVIDESWNAGQRKAAAQALRPEAFDPTLDSSKMTDEQKLRFYVRVILLDPYAYDLLIKLREKAPS